MGHPLTNLHVLVTRPSPQGEALCQRLSEAGAVAVHFPTLVIQPAQPSAELETALRAAAQADWLVFVSGNAVLHGLAQLEAYGLHLPESARIAVVGPATAKLLSERGIAVTGQPPSGYTSEDLLAELESVAFDGAEVVIFRGNGGRPMLARELMAKGARVHFAEVYRRLAPAFDAERYARWSAGQRRVVVLTSAEGMDNLLHAVPATARPNLLQATALVISDRLARIAAKAGFERIAHAAGPLDDELLAALVSISGAPGSN